jgi:hypothetical protein
MLALERDGRQLITVMGWRTSVFVVVAYVFKKKNGMRPFRRALVRGVVVRVQKKMA